MQIEIQLTHEPVVPVLASVALQDGVDGAWAEFTGLVRGEEAGRPIVALEYEAYDTMARKVLGDILLKLAEGHPCTAAYVIHRLGIIPVGEAALWIGVAAPHRKEAFALLAAFMDDLKRAVPIWKRRPIHADESGDPAAAPAS